MNLRQILTTSIALLLAHAAHAESNPVGAEPITVATSAGNEQSDFFLMGSGLSERVVFSSLTKQKSVNGAVVSDTRTMFQQAIYSIGGAGVNQFFTVTKSSPLKKITAFTIPFGMSLDSFVYDPDGDGSKPRLEFFHVPTKGIYVAKNGTSISLVRPETAAAPLIPGALKDPDHSYADADHTMQSRYVFGAKVPKKGYEPMVTSTSSKDTFLLKDIETGANIGSNPFDFVTFNHSVYFVTAPSEGGTTTPALWHLSVDTSSSKPKYSATIVASQNSLVDPHLAGSESELFLSTKLGSDDFHTLIATTDGVTFNTVVVTDDQGDPIVGAGHEPEQITPNIKPNLDGTGYTSFDVGNNRRFTVYSDINGASTFTDASGAIVNPRLITSTGSYFYYGGTYQGAQYVIRDFTGGNGMSNLTTVDGSPDALTDSDGNFLTNLGEIVFVHNPDPSDPDTDTGELYFTADVTRGGVTSTGLLWQYDPNSNDDIATTVKTNTGAEVVGAHNLRRVANGQIFRLYFCAPVNTTQNSEYLPLDKNGDPIQADFGTKPWVYAPQ